MDLRRVYSELAAAFVVCLLSLIIWQVVLPLIGIVDIIRSAERWGDLAAVTVTGATFYLALVAALSIVRGHDPRVHPLSVAYLAGWLVLIVSIILSTYNPQFNEIVGASLVKKGAFLVFFALLIGSLRYWREWTLADRLMRRLNPNAAPSQAARNAEREAGEDAGDDGENK